MASVTIDVSAEDAERLALLARKWECSQSEVIRRLLYQEQPDALPEIVPSTPIEPQDMQSQPIWEEIVGLMKDVPEEELGKLPRDGSENLDHYLYGSPKRQG